MCNQLTFTCCFDPHMTTNKLHRGSVRSVRANHQADARLDQALVFEGQENTRARVRTRHRSELTNNSTQQIFVPAQPRRPASLLRIPW
eukprot:m.191302 g.191302  ORF g.191302 m.191302 type:complete len:88 (-) comp53636_c0_seq4:584-847(-)